MKHFIDLGNIIVSIEYTQKPVLTQRMVDRYNYLAENAIAAKEFEDLANHPIKLHARVVNVLFVNTDGKKNICWGDATLRLPKGDLKQIMEGIKAVENFDTAPTIPLHEVMQEWPLCDCTFTCDPATV